MSTDLRLRHDLNHPSAFLSVLCGKVPMTLIEHAIAAEAVTRWGHPDWRKRGVIPTYFMTKDHSVFCRWLPVEGTHLWNWHFCQLRKPRIVIRSVEHFRELLDISRQPPAISLEPDYV